MYKTRCVGMRSLQHVEIPWWLCDDNSTASKQSKEDAEKGPSGQRREKSHCETSIPLLHLYLRRLEERPVFFLLALLSLCLEGPPAVHTSVSRFLYTIYRTNPFEFVAQNRNLPWLQKKKPQHNSSNIMRIMLTPLIGAEHTSKFFCHSLSRFAFSAASISSSLALFLQNSPNQ